MEKKQSSVTLFNHLGGDLAGGFSSGLVSITGNMAFGIVAFAPLGSEYIGLGILAGMFSSIIGGLFAALAGGAPAMISGPKIPTAILFASILTQLLASGLFDQASAPERAALLTLAFGAVLLSGLFQVIFGLTRLGTIVKFIPYPVVSAIRNCTAVLIIHGQVSGCLGLPKQNFFALLGNLNQAQPLTLLVAVVTACIVWKGPRYLPRLIVPVLGIASGTLIYYVILILYPSAPLCSSLGSIPSAFPKPEYLLHFLHVFTEREYLHILPSLLSASIAMATLNSIATLIALVTLQNFSGQRFDGNRELIGQGIGNIMGALFGGISSAGFISRTAQNYTAGGRTKFSAVANSLSVLVLLLVFSPLLSFVPKAAFSGLVFLIGCQLVDTWSLKQVRGLLLDTNRNSETLLNCLILVTVLFFGLFYDLVIAICAGMVISIIIFVVQMSLKPIRRSYSGAQARSNKKRPLSQMQALTARGHRIMVLELEGALFFGSADAVAVRIESLALEGARYCILDLKRITKIDTTAAHIIHQLQLRLRKKDSCLALSYVPLQGKERNVLDTLGLIQRIGEQYIFEDTDRALEYFEEKILATQDLDQVESESLSLHQRLGFDVLQAEDAIMIADYIEREQYQAGDILIRQGAMVDAIYFIAKGSAESSLYLPDTQRSKRLDTYTPGTYFGEMALLEQQESPVSIVAKEPLVCYHILLRNFEIMKKMILSLLWLL